MNEIYDDIDEKIRLDVQNRLLKDFEISVLNSVSDDFSGFNVLDIGCNRGNRFCSLFEGYPIRKGIGIDINPELVKEANANHGSDVFGFYCLDAESPDFVRNMVPVLKENSILHFDIICISYVLLHLKDPQKLLKKIRGFLADNGTIIITEPDDKASFMTADNEDNFSHMLKILDEDPFSGNRDFAYTLDRVAEESGYEIAETFPVLLRGSGKAAEQKRDVYNVFFSFLSADMKLLCESTEDNAVFSDHGRWIENHEEYFEAKLRSEECEIAAGVMIKTIKKAFFEKQTVPFKETEGFRLELLGFEEAGEAKKLTDFCVGTNLYSVEDFETVYYDCDSWFYFLKTESGENAGYIYFILSDMKYIENYTGIPGKYYTDIFGMDDPVVGDLKSGGVLPAFRKKKLSLQMYRFAVGELEEKGAEVLTGICWEYDGKIPIAPTLEHLGFKYLTTAFRPWYNHLKLICPVCKGRCVCDAAVYFKIINQK